MRALTAPFIVCGLILINAGQSSAALISTFDTDLEGWTPLNVILSWVDTGDPARGGVLEGQDVAFESYIIAPSLFTGDLTAYDGGTLSFFHRSSIGQVIPPDHAGRVFIIGSAGTVTTRTLPDLTVVGEWVQRSLDLTAAQFNASEATWQAILADVDEIRVVIDTSGSGGLPQHAQFDDFRIDGPDMSPVPEPSALALITIGSLSLLGCRRRARRPIHPDVRNC